MSLNNKLVRLQLCEHTRKRDGRRAITLLYRVDVHRIRAENVAQFADFLVLPFVAHRASQAKTSARLLAFGHAVGFPLFIAVEIQRELALAAVAKIERKC